ncbi:PH domain-containing protein [Ochrobactrum soli]|uniref:SHOCT domain-containing protein n=1 Tax=Ochrobactrum soli TaxID=2448455 RepID=A0A849KUK0_9HYPH|nr:PH domain-containing protein [[Ochrobactrum] soli]NNU61728.1 hypothetical protein [[Ochrobactrum] soli]
MRGISGVLLAIAIAVGLLGNLVGFFIIPVYFYFLLIGRHKRIERANARINSLLMNKEQLVDSAVEMRLNSLFARRRLLAITDSRIIVLHRKILGGYSMQDYQWKDLHDVVLTENAFPKYFGSTLEFKFVDALVGIVSITGIPSDEATQIYTYSQRQEQSWEEKRRIRKIEESRAKAGGVHINGLPGVHNSGTGYASSKSTVEQISEAKSLLDAGVISDVEFQEIKSKILGQSFL